MTRKSSAERIGVVVLGMHRSGTSALTRVLNLLGCDLPATLVDGADSNEGGHWESLPIAQLNDQILDSAGSTWWDWMPFNPGWYSSPKAAEFKEKAISVLGEQFGGSRLFVLKDPRICRFVPFWIEALQEAKIRPAVILPIRNPLEVADSLSKRDGFNPALGQLLWLRNVLEAEAGSRGLARLHITYDALLTEWPKVARAAEEALNLSWPRLSPRTSHEVNMALSGSLRHHKRSVESILGNPLLSTWLRDTFLILSRWAEEGESIEDHSTLDHIRGELDIAAPAFSHLISLGKYNADRAKTLEGAVKDIEAKLATAESSEQAKQAQIEELKRYEKQSAEAEARLAETQSELEDARNNLSRLQAELSEVTEEKQKHIEQLEEQGRERTQVSAQLDQAQSELARLRTEAGDYRKALDEARGELAHLQSELAQRQAEIDDTTRQLQETTDLYERRLKASLEQQAEDMLVERDRSAREMRAAHEQHKRELIAERERFEREMQAAREQQSRQTQEERERAERAEREMQAASEQHSQEIAAERKRSEREMQAASEQHSQEIAAERKRSEREMQAAREQHARSLEEERRRYNAELEAERTRTKEQVRKLAQQKEELEHRVSERFKEIATLTRLLTEKENAARISDEKAARLRDITTALLNGASSRSLKRRLSALIAAPIRLQKQKARLKRIGAFDSDAYLQAHPDVAEAGMDPLWHYVHHGIDEDRKLYPNEPDSEYKQSK